ncbi:MAG: WYL domain-containing protein [Acidimicrobiales bacterium]|jgi:predicted DNA-binding transcriptional regulator YafY
MAHPDRLERVTDLLLVLLDTTRPLSLREIAARVPGYPEGHDARRQAFERDKRLLRDEGVPVVTETVETEDQVGYRVDPDDYYLPDLGLEPDEQAALNLAVAGVHLGEPIGREALSKLGMGGQWPRRGAPLPLVDLPPVDGLPALPILFDAVRKGAVVAFTYRGEPRSVDVAGIRFRGGNWYVVGWDRDRQGARTFRVDRIDGLPVPGEAGSAAIPDGFDADGAFAREPWNFAPGDAVEVDVAVDAAEASRVVTALGPDAVIERSDDGAVVVRLVVTDVDALVSWVLDLLDHAEVLRPPEVRDAVVARLTAFVDGGAAR